MILYKDKNFITNSDHPNEDWVGNADYVIPDGSELANKVLSLYPNFSIEEDEEGNITDIIKSEPAVTEEQINEYKQNKINDSKVKLAEWLSSNPMEFTDGKFYSVTEEKQALLNGNLASYERAIKAGVEYPLKWNSTGEECVEWEYDNLLTLSLSIAAYVAPKVARQQSLEIQIKGCSTIEEIEAIEVNYD